MSFQDLEAGIRPSLRHKDSGKKNNQLQEDPSQAVAAGIFKINTAVSSFYRLVNSLGTAKDTLELRDKLHKTRLQIGQLVKDTSAKLKEASETDHHADVSPIKKIADAKLAKDFQSVLKEFQKAQRLAAERETTYAPFVPKELLPTRINWVAEVLPKLCCFLHLPAVREIRKVFIYGSSLFCYRPLCFKNIDVSLSVSYRNQVIEAVSSLAVDMLHNLFKLLSNSG